MPQGSEHQGAKAMCPVRAWTDHSSLGDRRRLPGERILGKAAKMDGMQRGPAGPGKNTQERRLEEEEATTRKAIRKTVTGLCEDLGE